MKLHFVMNLTIFIWHFECRYFFYKFGQSRDTLTLDFFLRESLIFIDQKATKCGITFALYGWPKFICRLKRNKGSTL